jgi:DNA replication and repair protein RecF
LQLSEFSSQGFRNLSSGTVSFGGGLTLVTGENAQGKTSLLEALALVCGQRSFRAAAMADMARDGSQFRAEAVLDRRGVRERVGVAWSRGAGRVFSRGSKASDFREISALSPAVFLAPEHQALLTGAPSLRRRFLDRIVFGLRPAAADDLTRYATALRERNALLAHARLGRSPGTPGELEAWTEELAIAGSAVRRHRRAALRIWGDAFEELAREAGAEYGRIRVTYAVEGDSDSPEGLRAACERLAAIECRRGYSLAGPHRDDLLWSREGRPLAALASTGEVVRTVALAKLAEWRVVAEAAGEPPLFAADDFDAGLSESWAREFVERLPEEATVLLTTTSAPARWSRRAAAVLVVRDGTVSPLPVLRAVEA